MPTARTLSIGLAIVAGMGVVVAAGPARADWDDHGWHHRWHRHGWYRPWGPPAVVVAPRAYYYAPPPPVYYPPPPVYYAPRPYYAPNYAPSVSFGVTIP